MSLNYQLGDIKNWKTVCNLDHGTEKARMNPITHSIIFATMAVDLGEITEKNALDFFERLDVIQREAGGMLFDHRDGKRVPYYITRDEVIAHIGLKTNVPNMKRSAWDKKQAKFKRRELERERDSERLAGQVDAAADTFIAKIKGGKKS